MTYRNRHEAYGALGGMRRSIIAVLLGFAQISQALMGLLAVDYQYYEKDESHVKLT